jgi:hypothetical protein
VRHHQPRAAAAKEAAVKRVCLFAVVTVLSLAQRSRDDYRAVYRGWKQTDPNLERDASTGGAPIAQRADRLAAEAAKTAAARKEFLEGTAQDEAQQVEWLGTASLIPESTAASSKSDEQFIKSEAAAVTRTIDTFANDPDKGMQQLRQALAKERVALDTLAPVITQRKKAADEVTASGSTIEEARTKALEQSRAMLEGFKNAAASSTNEAAAWAEYYRKIGEGAQGAATPITEVLPGAPPAVLNNPVPAPPTVTPLPLARYVGAWTFPQTNGLYHGPQPEFIDLLVHEENGRATGSAFARFKLPPGATGDPIVRFDFSGEFQPARRQIFDLVTAEGAKGTIELIPGPAFNLLEVNFQTEPKPGKIRQADVILVKK